MLLSILYPERQISKMSAVDKIIDEQENSDGEYEDHRALMREAEQKRTVEIDYTSSSKSSDDSDKADTKAARRAEKLKKKETRVIDHLSPQYGLAPKETSKETSKETPKEPERDDGFETVGPTSLDQQNKKLLDRAKELGYSSNRYTKNKILDARRYLYTWSLSEEDARNAVHAITNKICQQWVDRVSGKPIPSPLSRAIRKSVTRFMNSNVFDISTGAIIIGTRYFEYPEQVDGILIEQVLNGFKNPKLAAAVPCVREEIQKQYIALYTRLVNEYHKIAETAKSDNSQNIVPDTRGIVCKVFANGQYDDGPRYFVNLVLGSGKLCDASELVPKSEPVVSPQPIRKKHTNAGPNMRRVALERDKEYQRLNMQQLLLSTSRNDDEESAERYKEAKEEFDRYIAEWYAK